MKHLFAPYEIAKQLKDKGFNEHCLAVYDNRMLCVEFSYETNSEFASNYQHQYVLAPTYQQIVDFFRDKHNIVIESTTWVEVTTWMIRNRMSNETLWNNAIKDYYEGYNKAILEAFKLI